MAQNPCSAMTGLEALNALADQRKAERYPNVPHRARVKANYCDKTANDLTRCIVDWFDLNRHFTTRLSSTGTYRNDLGKYVPSQQRAGMPDVYAIVRGHAVHVEVKVGADRLSDVQKQTILAMQKSGALLFIAHDFEGFYGWYQTYIRTLPALPAMQNMPPHPIPWRATPDLLPPQKADQQEP